METQMLRFNSVTVYSNSIVHHLTVEKDQDLLLADSFLQIVKSIISISFETDLYSNTKKCYTRRKEMIRIKIA